MPAASLSEERAQELGINRDLCMQNLAAIRQNPQIREKLVELFNDEYIPPIDQDPEHMLYQGFFSEADRAAIELIQQAPAEQLAIAQYQFNDPRLHTCSAIVHGTIRIHCHHVSNNNGNNSVLIRLIVRLNPICYGLKRY